MKCRHLGNIQSRASNPNGTAWEFEPAIDHLELNESCEIDSTEQLSVAVAFNPSHCSSFLFPNTELYTTGPVFGYLWTDLSKITSVDLKMTRQRQHICFSAPQTSLFSIAGDANGDCACSKMLPTVLHHLNYLRRDGFTLCTWCLQRIKKQQNTFTCRSVWQK